MRSKKIKFNRISYFNFRIRITWTIHNCNSWQNKEVTTLEIPEINRDDSSTIIVQKFIKIL